MISTSTQEMLPVPVVLGAILLAPLAIVTLYCLLKRPRK